MNDILFNLKTKNTYQLECYDSNGKLKWNDSFENMVVTEGLNLYLDSTLKTGAASPVWYVGLKGTGTVVLGDVMNSHANWVEISAAYSNSTRPVWTPGTISGGSVSNTASKAVFNITEVTPITLYGAFMTSNNTKGGTTGVLFGAGDFAIAKTVSNGDTVYTTITCSII